MAELKKNGLATILIYTDCFIFGGCENVLVNMINSGEIKKLYRFIFSYNNNREYRTIARERIRNADLHPINLLSNDSWFYKINIKTRSKTIRLIAKFPFWFLQEMGIYFAYNFLRLLIYFKKVNPDILFINNGGYPGALTCRAAVFSAKVARIKKIIFNVNNIATKQKGFIDRMVDKYIVCNVDRFITASAAAKLCLSDRRNVNINKCCNIPNTLPNDYFKIDSKELLRKEYGIEGAKTIIGSVGLLTKRKGYNILIDAIDIINDRSKGVLNSCVFIFGEGEERRNLENQILRKNLERLIHLPGYKSNIMEYVKSFDIFVLPSTENEDFPYVILEAMALGKPIIGTRVAGIPEQVEHGRTGFICEPGDAESLANAIMELLENRVLAKSMGVWSRKKYEEEFEYSLIMKRYIELFNTVMWNTK